MNRFLFLALLCLSFSAFSQAPFRKVYKTENGDGSVSIWGENNGFLPYTMTLKATLNLMHSSTPLPARIVLLPSKQPQLLTILKPVHPSFSYNYSYHFDLGIYTGQLPDTAVVYELPFKYETDSINVKRPDNLYIYTFRIPARTPVVAAREGIVAAIHYGKKSSVVVNNNLIYVYHDDGSHACYENIEKNSATVEVGQRVKQGETIGYFEGNEKNPYLWFSVEYPSISASETLPVIFRVGSNLMRPH